MNEDYLWDKTGTVDPEIERLENTLAMFRYKEIDAPALPAKIIPFERKQPKNFFRLAFAFGTCAAIAAICFGIWLQVSGNKIEIAQETLKTISSPMKEEVVSDVPTIKSNNLLVKTVEAPKASAEPKIIKVRNVIQPRMHQNKLIAPKTNAKKPEIKLTEEEKFAYDQLMLALSITSSKFKLVKDKVHGIEEKNVERQNAR